MNKTKPLFDPSTHYRIEVQGLIDVDWLQSFDGTTDISIDGTQQAGEITLLDVHTDQSGIVGLVRRLHGLGITILQMQIVSDGGEAFEVEE